MSSTFINYLKCFARIKPGNNQLLIRSYHRVFSPSLPTWVFNTVLLTGTAVELFIIWAAAGLANGYWCASTRCVATCRRCVYAVFAVLTIIKWNTLNWFKLKCSSAAAHQTHKWSLAASKAARRTSCATSLWQSIVAPECCMLPHSPLPILLLLFFLSLPMTNSHSEALSFSLGALRCTTAQSIMHVMSPPGFSSTCSSSSSTVPAPTACCLEISSLVPCIGFGSPLLLLPSFAAVVAETAKYVQCESADVLEQLPAGSLSKLHKCQLVSSYRTLFYFPFLCPLCPLLQALARSDVLWMRALPAGQRATISGIDALSQCQCQCAAWECGQYVKLNL